MESIKRDSALYELTQTVQGRLIFAAFKSRAERLGDNAEPLPDLPPLLMHVRRGYAESPGWVMVQVAEFLPEPLTVALFRRRAVYAAPGLTAGLLELLASETWLDRRGDAYHITDAGRETLDVMAKRTELVLAGFEPLPPADLARLAELVGRVIDASLRADDPPGVWCLQHSVNRAADADAAPVRRLFQWCADFNAFRDDAHMAAQREQDIDGHDWEAFSMVASGQATTAHAIYHALAYRGYSIEDWEQSLSLLAKRGWLQAAAEDYNVTGAGQAAQRAIERATDHHFYAPWDCLSPGESDEMLSLLSNLKDACETIIG
jgi:hypothetical protein